MHIYLDNFDSWEDVKEAYAGTRWDYSNGVAIDQNDEPEHVFAQYENENYEGSSLVAYYNKGKFYINEGGHCSCYGLEGQWEPTDYEPDTFKAMVDRLDNEGTWVYGMAKYKSQLLELYKAALAS